jgi:hypothetical protein
MACSRCGYASAYGATDCPRCRGGFTGMTAHEARNLQDSTEQAGTAIGGCLVALIGALTWIGTSRPMSLVWAAIMLSWVTLTPGMLIALRGLPPEPSGTDPLLYELIPLWYLIPAVVAPLVVVWIYRERIMAWRKWVFAVFVLVSFLTVVFV